VLLAAGAAGILGAGYWFLSGGSPAAAAAVPKAAPKPAFTGGDQGFVSLKLAEVENVNHNTRRFRFELPEGDNVSGLHVASALLAKYKGPNDEKATLRPYTPTSDEGLIFPPCLPPPTTTQGDSYCRYRTGRQRDRGEGLQTQR
jgi:cytochrome-b5 reductase